MKKLVIFTGHNQRAIIALLRTCKAYDIEFILVAESEDDTIYLTDYKEKIFIQRDDPQINKKDIFHILNKIKSNFSDISQFIIIPSTESLNRFFLKNRKKIIANNFDVPLVEEKLYKQISDKHSFSDLCKKHKIEVPNEINPEEISIPCVAKPKKFLEKTNLSPFLILNHSELNHFKKLNQSNNFYFQKFIKGQSYYLLYYFHKNGSVFKYSQQNIVQQSDGKSIVYAISSNIHNKLISQSFEKLFKNINYFGLVMVEIKKFKNTYYMIEANPRLWGPSQLFVDSNCNLFLPFLNDLGLLDSYSFKETEKNRKKQKYLWFGGILETIKNEKKLAFHTQICEKKCLLKMHNLLRFDVYKRSDTINLFKKELTQ